MPAMVVSSGSADLMMAANDGIVVMDIDYAGNGVVVEMEHGSFVFTPLPGDLMKTYGGKLITPVEMREPRVKVYGVFPITGVVGNIHANGEASLRHYGRDHRVWIGKDSLLTFTRDSGALIPPAKRWKAAWMEVQEALKAFQTQVEDWEARCMCLTIHREVMELNSEAEKLSGKVRDINILVDDLTEYRRSL